jgi:RNA polymerase sigma-70 factor, ECF subfamily
LAEEPGEITRLLFCLKQGDAAAEEQLIPLVYSELRRLAGYYLRQERNAFTLQPTVLVHEAYLRLTGLRSIDWQNSSHFFAIAATAMKRILVDHARQRVAAKRGGGGVKVDLDQVQLSAPMEGELLLALDEALSRLSSLDPRQSKVVELRFFAGLSEDETATVLGISPRTVKRDWRMAKAWLHSQLAIKI